MGKRKDFKVKSFRNFLLEAEIHAVIPIYGKSALPLYGKSMEKQKHFKFMGFLNISDEAEIHTIPRTCEM